MFALKRGVWNTHTKTEHKQNPKIKNIKSY